MQTCFMKMFNMKLQTKVIDLKTKKIISSVNFT
jgi:hypothetical protein